MTGHKIFFKSSSEICRAVRDKGLCNIELSPELQTESFFRVGKTGSPVTEKTY